MIGPRRVLYLNPDWSESDGGHLQLVPFPGKTGRRRAAFRPTGVVRVARYFAPGPALTKRALLRDTLVLTARRPVAYYGRRRNEGRAAVDGALRVGRATSGRGVLKRATRPESRSTPRCWTAALHTLKIAGFAGARRRFGGVDAHIIAQLYFQTLALFFAPRQ